MNFWQTLMLWTMGLSIATQGVAVEESSLSERFVLIGVISTSDGDSKGIVVIKDTHTHKSYTLRKGDRIPKSPELSVASIERNHVVISSTKKTFNIAYAGAVVTNNSDQVVAPEIENLYADPSETIADFYLRDDANAQDQQSIKLWRAAKAGERLEYTIEAPPSEYSDYDSYIPVEEIEPVSTEEVADPDSDFEQTYPDIDLVE